MANANPESGTLKEILNHLTALNTKVDKGFKEVDKRFEEAADERQAIRNEMQGFRKKTEDNFAGLYREMPQMGSELYDKIEGYNKESLKFQRDSYLFQQQSLAFQQQTQASLQESHAFEK